MDYLLSLVYQNIDFAHWIIFFALIVAGFNIPISEDIMLITTGLLASTFVPEHAMRLCLFAFCGCYISDWIAYVLGRFLGRRILSIRIFAKTLKLGRLRRIKRFYGQYGTLTLRVGRFIPFGVRNGLFITAGMIKMKFIKFILFDGIACMVSNSVLICLAYIFGKNYDILCKQVKWFNIIFFLIVALIAGVMFFKKIKKMH